MLFQHQAKLNKFSFDYCNNNQRYMFAKNRVLHHFKLYFPIPLEKIQNCLKNMQLLDYKNTAAICVSLNGLSESPENCQLLYSSLLEARSSHRRLSVYTFLQDKATSLTYFTATAGKTVTANPYTLIGDVGTAQKSYRNIKKLLDLLGIRYEELGSKHESSRIWNQFVEKNEREKQIAHRWIETVQKNMIDSVHQQRGLPKEQLLSIKNKLYHPNEALSLKLIDSVSTFEEFVQLNYPNDKIEDHVYQIDGTKIKQNLTERELAAISHFFQVSQMPQVPLFSNSDPLQESLKQFFELLQMRLMSSAGLQSLQSILGQFFATVDVGGSRGQLMFEW